MSITIRPASGGDVAAIDALLRTAFPAPDEAMLVQRLCIDGDMVLTLVADDEDDGMLAGMVAFSRMAVDIAGKPVAAVALAPVAVAASHRRQGVGEALVRAGLQHLADAGVHLCFVLGDPDYYGRFGFAARPGLSCEGVPDLYVQALAFNEPPPWRPIVFHPAFFTAK